MHGLSDFERGKIVSEFFAGASITRTASIFSVSRWIISKVILLKQKKL